jgi:hypothetical protein
MTEHRSHSAAFKRQIAQEFIGREALHGLYDPLVWGEPWWRSAVAESKGRRPA